MNGIKFLGFRSSPFYPCRQFLFWWRVPPPDIIGPCKINQVIGTKFLGFRSLLIFKNLKIIFKLFRFCTSNFFTDDRCEHAKMKQFTLVAVNIRSQYTLFCKNRWIFNTKLITRLVTVLIKLELLSWNGKLFVLDDYLFMSYSFSINCDLRHRRQSWLIRGTARLISVVPFKDNKLLSPFIFLRVLICIRMYNIGHLFLKR